MDIRVFRKMPFFFLLQNSFILPVSLQVIVLRHLEAKLLIQINPAFPKKHLREMRFRVNLS